MGSLGWLNDAALGFALSEDRRKGAQAQRRKEAAATEVRAAVASLADRA
jgi:hypothetical protein